MIFEYTQGEFCLFLAHLSRRLKRELIVYQSSCRLCLCVCLSVNIFKLEYIIISLFVVTAAGVVPCGIRKKRPVHRP